MEILDIFPEFPEASSTLKDKGALKKQHKIYLLSHRSLNCTLYTSAWTSGNQKTKSNKYEEYNMSAFILLTTGTHNSIQAQSLFTHVLINIVVGLYRKANE